jgi:hypothetical protein
MLTPLLIVMWLMYSELEYVCPALCMARRTGTVSWGGIEGD